MTIKVSFLSYIRSDLQLTWKMNLFLSSKDKVTLLLEPADTKKWVVLKKLNWLIAIFIVSFSLLTNDHKFLWGLLIFPIFLASGLLAHRTVLSCLTILFVFKYFIGFNSSFFWFILFIFLATYLLNKVAQEFLEKSIFKIAFSDFNTFWKYYSNKLIYVDETKLNSEFQDLVVNYPELNV